jgi:uncharacterized RmlC-like cupin family protein
MDRQQAFADDTIWAGLVRTEPETSSGWHHHGDHVTVAFVVRGALRFDFGIEGREAALATAGDFARVPPHLVHRESTPSDEPCEVVVIRVGRGESNVNVDGPAAG